MSGFGFNNVGFVGSLGPSGPTPGFSLYLPGIAARGQSLVTGLSAATAVTVCALISKPVAATNLYLAYCFDEPVGGNRTDLAFAGTSYSPPVGLGMNTYTSAFTTANNRNVFPTANFVLVSAVFYPGTQTKDPLITTDPAQFKLYVGGARQPLAITNAPQANRTFSNNIYVGGDSGSTGLNWPGQIKELYLYESDLSDADRQRTEAYLQSLP